MSYSKRSSRKEQEDGKRKSGYSHKILSARTPGSNGDSRKLVKTPGKPRQPDIDVEAEELAAAKAKARRAKKGGSKPRKPLKPPPLTPVFCNCQPLLNLLFKTRHLAGEVWMKFASPLLMDLLPLVEDVDQAVILTDLMIHDVRGHNKFVPLSREGERGEDVEPGWHVNIHEHPDQMFGIPYRRFKRAVERLAKKKLITRRDPVLWETFPVGSVNPEWKKKTGKWLLNVRWKKQLRKIAEKISMDDLEDAMYLPWALRAMLAVPNPNMHKDTEDGLGTLLMSLLMFRHTCHKTGRPRPRTQYKGKRWSDHTLEQWADEQLKCSIQQFRAARKRLSHVLEDDWKGARHSRVTLLRPRYLALMRLWHEHGTQYITALRRHVDGAFVFP